MNPSAQTEPDQQGREKRDFRQEVTDNIIRVLEHGVAPWQKPWESGRGADIPMNPTTGKSYRGGNAIHLLTTGIQRGYGDPRWMTYKQAAEQGWHVRKGEKGAQIEFWDVKNPGADSHQTRPALDQSAAPGDNNDSHNRSRLIHRIYSVFNASQIEGTPPYTPKEKPTFEVVQSGEEILKNSGATIKHDQTDRAFYDRRQDSIHLPGPEAFRDPAAYYGTALHELAHFSGHPSRLNRSTLNEAYRFGDTNYAKEELRAELASIFLAAERGIPHDPQQHAAYVGEWIKTLKTDKNEIFRAAHDASAAAEYLLGLERDQSREVHTNRADSGTTTSPLREAQDIAAASLGEAVKTYPAQTESGAYKGPILGATENHLVQRVSAQSAVAHPKQLLNSTPGIGQNVSVIYHASKGAVREVHERVKTPDRGR